MPTELKIVACESFMLRPRDRLRLSAYRSVPDHWPMVIRVEHAGGSDLVTIEGSDYPLLVRGIVHAVWGDWTIDDRDQIPNPGGKKW